MAISKNVLYIVFISFCSVSVLALSGCAELNPIDASRQILKTPLGTDPVRVGMTKEEVVSIWGKPDLVNQLQSSDQWQMPREEWVYTGRYQKVPLDTSYMFKTKYVIFDGNNLVSIGERSGMKDDSQAEAGPAEGVKP